MRVSEVYASTQGEGPRVGQTTVFVRFGGCNLRCPGWPCDTQHAIDPRFRREWIPYEVDDLVRATERAAQLSGAQLITLTGGEPFLQRNSDLCQFVETLIGKGYKVEAFSNGTLQYPPWAIKKVHFIMDWKLPGSGEDHHDKTRLENIDAFTTWSGHAVKFVCKDEHDFDVAHSLWSVYLKNYEMIEVFYGRVWNGEITDARLCELVMQNKLPWSLNVQLHNHIWPVNERGR